MLYRGWHRGMTLSEQINQEGIRTNPYLERLPPEWMTECSAHTPSTRKKRRSVCWQPWQLYSVTLEHFPPKGMCSQFFSQDRNQSKIEFQDFFTDFEVWSNGNYAFLFWQSNKNPKTSLLKIHCRMWRSFFANLCKLYSYFYYRK